MRIGILGGSFDPPHVGHLVAALDALDALSLTQLQVVPAAVQPLKRGAVTAASHRLEMTRRCFSGLARIEVDDIEMERGGVSFTVDTVETYRRQWPSADLHLLVGEDAVASLARWREPERLLSMVRLVVVTRAFDAAPSPPPSPSPYDESVPDEGRVVRLAFRRVDVSSTEIRARVRNGRSIRGFVPDAVADYIASTGLYLQELPALADPDR